MISVVIPVYNAAGTVERTLRSVVAQTFSDYEIIVVDDGSADDSVAVVEAMNIPGVRIVSQANAGVAAARNAGIRLAKGEFVAFLDADDEWHPEYLATQAALTRRYPQCDVFAVNYEFHKPDGRIEKTIINRLPFEGEDSELTNYFEVASCSHPPLWTSAVMARKSALEAVGGFPVGIRSGEDLLTWARLAEKFRIAYSRKALAYFNVLGYDNSEKPKREPQVPDVVGVELGKLRAPYIRRYRAHWHRMRANIYLRLGRRGRSLTECGKSLCLYPGNYKVWALGFLALLPTKILKSLGF